MSYFATNNVTADASKAQSEFQPVPEGVYPMTCIKAEEKLTQTGYPMLSLQFEIDMSDAGFIGRKLFANIMLDHANDQTRNIGQSQLHALLFMTGLTTVKDPTEFLGKSMSAKVKVQKRTDNGQLQNQIVFARPSPKAADVKVSSTQEAPKQTTPGW